MSDEERPADDAGLSAGEYEAESGHEKRQRLRSERIRKWRKEARHPRAGDFDDRAAMPPPPRFVP
ncbi:MAG: hypothetical protein NDJ72_05955 [Elusimicrobia bacterium]|nr:hypothetical protein [Elusimicrobiota bacterium]